MNKNELVTAVAQRADQPKAAVDAVVTALGEVVRDALLEGDKVTVPGLLTAERVERAERQGRNPQTGEAMTIAASSGVKLSAAAALKNAVKGA